MQCHGPPAPCEACLERATECVFKAENDKRRKLARRAKDDEADFHRKLLDGLLHTIRSSQESHVKSLVDVVRGGADLAEIMAYIESNLNEAQAEGARARQASEELEEIRAGTRTIQPSPSGARTRRKVMDVSELVKPPPLFHLPAKPWTTVIDDDAVVSELVSVYFSWWNTFHRPIEQSYFIEAMRAGDTDTSLCSPYLVNSILTLACVGLTADPGRTTSKH